MGNSWNWFDCMLYNRNVVVHDDLQYSRSKLWFFQCAQSLCTTLCYPDCIKMALAIFLCDRIRLQFVSPSRQKIRTFQIKGKPSVNTLILFHSSHYLSNLWRLMESFRKNENFQYISLPTMSVIKLFCTFYKTLRIFQPSLAQYVYFQHNNYTSLVVII